MLGAEARFLLDACPSAVLVLGPQGHVAFANRHACELFGAGCGIVGLPATELIPEWPLPAQGRARLLIRGGRERERFCDVRTSSSPGVEGPMQTVWIDRAARDPAAEQALIDADRRLRYMIEMLPQAVCVFDAEDRYVLWNQLYADLYADIAHHLRPGITFEEILRLSLASGSIQEVIPDPDDWLAERMATRSASPR